MKDVAKQLFIDVINEHVLSISQSVMRDVTAHLGSDVWIYDELQKKVLHQLSRYGADGGVSGGAGGIGSTDVGHCGALLDVVVIGMVLVIDVVVGNVSVTLLTMGVCDGLMAAVIMTGAIIIVIVVTIHSCQVCLHRHFTSYIKPVYYRCLH